MTVVVIGLGLIGGSIGKGLIESGLAAHVVGVDRDRAACRIAQQRGCVQSIATDLAQVDGAHLWVLAVPPFAVASLLPRVAEVAAPHAVVTDTCSVKTPIHDAVPEGLRARFVGGHPMAGHQASGIMYARSDLFRNAYWVLCPNEQNRERDVRRVESLVYAMDARPICMSSETHDANVALLSHVPHVLASLLAAMGDQAGCAGIAGGSWRDLTRVAASDPALWEQIIRSNRVAIAGVISEIVERLGELRDALTEDDAAAVSAFLRTGHLAKQRQILGSEGRPEA